MSYGFNGWQEVVDNAKEKAIPKYLPIFNKVINLSLNKFKKSKLTRLILGSRTKRFEWTLGWIQIKFG